MAVPGGGATWLFGLSPADTISLAGVTLSLVLNGINFRWTSTLQSKSNKLDHFNTQARQPIAAILDKMHACTDEVDDIIRNAPVDPAAAVLQQANLFHRSRRSLDRILNNLQNSPMIDGQDWYSLQYTECDDATTALETARSAPDARQRKIALEEFQEQVVLLSRRLNRMLDDKSSKLVG